MISKQLIWIVICIYHEARNQPEEGQIAVGHVLQPNQFSWANDAARPAIKEYGALEKSCEMAEKCLAERLEGKNLFGADHYFADSIKAPAWVAKMKLVKKIGNHTFYRS